MDSSIVTARATVIAAFITGIFGFGVGVLGYFKPSDKQIIGSTEYKAQLSTNQEQATQIGSLREEIRTLQGASATSVRDSTNALNQANSALRAENSELRERLRVLESAAARGKEELASGAVKASPSQGSPTPDTRISPGKAPNRTSYLVPKGEVIRTSDGTTISMHTLRDYASSGPGASFYVNGKLSWVKRPGERVDVRSDGTVQCYFEVISLEGNSTKAASSARAKLDYVCPGS